MGPNAHTCGCSMVFVSNNLHLFLSVKKQYEKCVPFPRKAYMALNNSRLRSAMLSYFKRLSNCFAAIDQMK